MSKKVLGLGAAAMDIVLQCGSLPREDSFAFIYGEQLLPGGSCANVLVALARLGTPASLVAALGDDHYGVVFKDELSRVGVDTSNIKIRANGTTLHTYVTVDGRGARSIFVNPGDSLLSLQAADVNGSMLEGIGVFYTDMFPGQPALKLARLAREREIPVVFALECAPSFMELCGIVREEIEEILSCCSLFCGGREALQELAGETDPWQAADRLYHNYRPPLGLIATLGEAGAIWVTETETIHVPAFAVKAVDTTGAGDAFAGGLIHAYFFQGEGQKASLQFASACAALKCTRLGARLQAGEEQVRAFLQEHK
ncbi:MAG: carbohydrate kinase family protein [Bacillota bacterium]